MKTNAKEAKEVIAIKLPTIDIQRFTLRVIGDSPLITHKWSDKAKKLMLATQEGKPKPPKEKKNPWQDFLDSLYWMPPSSNHIKEGDYEALSKWRFGIPAVVFKKAAVNACSHVDGITKVLARGAFHVEGEFVEILGDTPVMREDMVRVGMGIADIRYRGMFERWEAELSIRYNAGVLSVAQIAHLFNVGGFASGVGEWRPERNGSFGMFHVAKEGE